MNSFLNKKLENFPLTNGMGALLAHAAKEEGSEGELSHLEPAFVETLKKTSIITSATASCAIEGINVPEQKLAALVNKTTSPAKREEHEVLNYKNALDFIFNSTPSKLRPTPELLLRIHRLAMTGSPQAGIFKQRDNQIIEHTETGPRLRFTPTPAKETPSTIEKLCLSYNEAINKESAAPQVCLAALILDFTCIHPFHDGNGRVSRLLTTAALLEMGLIMPKMISLEEITQTRQDAYYTTLEKSSQGWHTSNHDLTPFLRFHLELVSQGYLDLQRKIQRTRNPITVVFDTSIPPKTIEVTFNNFQKVYRKASWKKADILSRGRKITIEGFSPTNLDTFDDLKHANRLAERCLETANQKPPPGSHTGQMQTAPGIEMG